jgi:hypothetical protein
MRLLPKLAALATLAGALAAAPRADAAYESTYFPLKVGNVWNYAVSGPQTANATSAAVTVDASWRSPVTGQTWYRIRGYNGDLHWVMQTSAHRVYEWQTQLWYRLGVAAGPRNAWTMQISDDAAHGAIEGSKGAKLEIVSRDEQLTVPAGSFDTIHIRWTTGVADAGVTDEWFAQGVGLVQRQESRIWGAQLTVLQNAIVSGTYVGSKAQEQIAVQTDQSSYTENHMPGPGPVPTQGPEIKVSLTVTPLGGVDRTLNFTDYNVWSVVVYDGSGHSVWVNPKIMAPAPSGGLNRTIPAAGRTDVLSVHLPYGSDQGTYTVHAQLLVSKDAPTEVTTFFQYGWTF